MCTRITYDKYERDKKIQHYIEETPAKMPKKQKEIHGKIEIKIVQNTLAKVDKLFLLTITEIRKCKRVCIESSCELSLKNRKLFGDCQGKQYGKDPY